MAPSTRQTLRLVMKPNPAHPLGPPSSSGIQKSRKRLSPRKSSSLPSIKAKRPDTDNGGHRPSVDVVTAIMSSMTISKRPTKPPQTGHRERPSSIDDVTATMTSKTISDRPTQAAPQSAVPPAPPSALPLPPTTLEALPVAQPETQRTRHDVVHAMGDALARGRGEGTLRDALTIVESEYL